MSRVNVCEWLPLLMSMCYLRMVVCQHRVSMCEGVNKIRVVQHLTESVNLSSAELKKKKKVHLPFRFGSLSIRVVFSSAIQTKHARLRPEFNIKTKVKPTRCFLII